MRSFLRHGVLGEGLSWLDTAVITVLGVVGIIVGAIVFDDWFQSGATILATVVSFVLLILVARHRRALIRYGSEEESGPTIAKEELTPRSLKDVTRYGSGRRQGWSVDSLERGSAGRPTGARVPPRRAPGRPSGRRRASRPRRHPLRAGDGGPALSSSASAIVPASPRGRTGCTESAGASSSAAPVNSLSTSTPAPPVVPCATTNSLATRFMPSWSGVTRQTSASR